MTVEPEPERKDTLAFFRKNTDSKWTWMRINKISGNVINVEGSYDSFETAHEAAYLLFGDTVAYINTEEPSP